ncbi:YHS domain-containing (seleno)protein [Tropicimonas sp. TH_r6]|uniref:YHS domain-containing (seleno)protein n=1 Tax=Tropicimonas sp. TH_r6 TaxID=3082085 RepID=UPI002953B8A0|nr:YHS domain-containing (seleno)protein [Tropicimonas sp. TH_r6]MDV7144616.1 YHS domain-containing (seleno)protein [Tropicimonas sp. TH_r6]
MRLIPSLALGLALSASAALAGEEYTAANGLAVSGYDVVAYFGLEQSELGTPQPAAIPGHADLTVEHDGATFAFSSEENLSMFEADPEKYVPQYDGHCAFGVAKGGKVPGNPNLWRIVDGKLYLNITQNVVGFWEEDISGNLELSEANWAELEAQPASTKPIPEFEPMAPVN